LQICAAGKKQTKKICGTNSNKRSILNHNGGIHLNMKLAFEFENKVFSAKKKCGFVRSPQLKIRQRNLNWISPRFKYHWCISPVHADALPFFFFFF